MCVMFFANLSALNISREIVYILFAAGAYGCIFTVLVLALIFGPRALRNVKRRKITALPQGLSPLDVQRIFIGKTYPRKLTRALLVWWAQCGYIKIEQISKYKVRVRKLRGMPRHLRPRKRAFRYFGICDDKRGYHKYFKTAAFKRGCGKVKRDVCRARGRGGVPRKALSA